MLIVLLLTMSTYKIAFRNIYTSKIYQTWSMQRQSCMENTVGCIDMKVEARTSQPKSLPTERDVVRLTLSLKCWDDWMMVAFLLVT